MGTDVHPYAEYRPPPWAPWVRIAVSMPAGRNYAAFALLANVRNGFGFAGIPTHEAVIPIAEPRGLPEDTAIKENWIEKLDWHDIRYVSLGDHSFSWVTLKELKSIDLDAPLTEMGFVDQETARKLETKEISRPDSWCGGTTRKDWVSRQWDTPLREAAWLIPAWIRTLEEWKKTYYLEHTEDADQSVRIVFGFDS